MQLMTEFCRSHCSDLKRLIYGVEKKIAMMIYKEFMQECWFVTKYGKNYYPYLRSSLQIITSFLHKQ